MRVRPWVAAVLGAALVCSALPAGADPPRTQLPRQPQLATPVLSARRVPGLLRSRIADQKLQATFEQIAKDAPPTSCFVVTDHGRVVVAHDADTPVQPASTNKLLTATALLQTLPADAVVSTQVVASAPADNGVVHGNVWVVGGGNSILTTGGYKPTFEDPAQLSSDFGSLADSLRAAGVTRIEGDVLGDESRYDTERSVSTWTANVRKESGPLSALLVNDGNTGYASSPDTPAKVRKPGEPAALAGETLRTLLTDRGITVTGTAGAATAPAGAVELARFDVPVEDLVTEMLSWSDNTTAELLLKEIGLQANKRGTTADGLQAVQAKLTAMGLPVQGLVVNDGSGLDGGDRLTCNLLVGLLDKQGLDSPLGKGLAIAGQRGTLRKRMRRTAVDGKLWAKTGTLATVAALAGFVQTDGGELLTFAFVENGQKDAKTEAVLDDLAVSLARYPEAPTVGDLGPRPPG